MKKSELIKIIRTAVRQELTESLPKIVSEVLNQPVQPTETDPVELTKALLKNETSVPRIKKKKPQTRYSKNEALNQVLNETVGGIPSDGPRVDGGEPQMTDLNGQTVDVEALPDHVSNALTRNYSDVLKLVDKKRGKTT